MYSGSHYTYNYAFYDLEKFFTYCAEFGKDEAETAGGAWQTFLKFNNNDICLLFLLLFIF